MKTLIMETVHALLEQSGQTVPAKHLSVGERSLQVYDVEHWPESFNSLLLHDFPSLVISIDTSAASLSGFVVTLHWKPAVDLSQCVGVFIHCLVVFILILCVMRSCWTNLEQVSLENLEYIRALYFANGTSAEFGTYGPSSLLTDQLRAVMSHGEL